MENFVGKDVQQQIYTLQVFHEWKLKITNMVRYLEVLTNVSSMDTAYRHGNPPPPSVSLISGTGFHDSIFVSVRNKSFGEKDPKGSMYGIFTYIYHKKQLNVDKYTSPMDFFGDEAFPRWVKISPLCQVIGSAHFLSGEAFFQTWWTQTWGGGCTHRDLRGWS